MKCQNSIPFLKVFLFQGILTLGLLSLLGDAGRASPKDDGYRGIWFTLGQKTPYGDKYSGGLGTYTANHVPMAVYSPETKKTFFVYGGAKQGKRHLLEMISYYDHVRRVVPRPTIVHDKKGVNDPHDNPSLCIDGKGYLWVFISGRGRKRPGFIYRSAKPYDIDDFQLQWQGEITYPQPRWIEGKGFLHLFTKYTNGRELYWSTSPDGRTWAKDHKFAGIEGHYQTSHQVGNRVITAFNRHPGHKPDNRTDLYYMETDDFGKTWKNDRGETLKLPLTKPDNPARVRNYSAEKRMVYIADLDLDAQGRPAILYITSASYIPGPPGKPRWWTVAHWTGDRWEYTEITHANHNYCVGELTIEGNTWRIIGPTEPGPQPIGTGGEVALWISRDEGKTWTKQRDVTRHSPMNHTYVRRVIDAHPEFYAYWADGNPDKFSPSRLYFCDKTGEKVWQLPSMMYGDCETPKLITKEK
ncbi:MAG: BNR-4 repeat-containing protein [Pirellulales bacterium]|nr:BNR-4 repeat-containing protein [Pirellulales bacterium]